MSFSFDTYVSTGFGAINDDTAGRAAMKALYAHNFGSYLKDVPANAAILDVGCGMGQCVEWLVDAGYTNVRGIDPSKETAAYCQSQKLPVEQVEDTIAWLTAHTDTFDMIYCNDVIEHIAIDELILFTKALYRALTPGGQLIIKTNNVSAITGARMRYWDITHTTSFTEFSLGQLLGMAGVPMAAWTMHPFTFSVRSIKRLIRASIRSVVHRLWKLVYWAEYTIVPQIVHEYFYVRVVKK